MWEEDEDNNPYGSFNRRTSTASDDGNPTSPGGLAYVQPPQTPPSGQSSPNNQDSPEFISHSQDLSDVEYDDDRPPGRRVEPKKGGYDSRVEQILYENPDLEIQIIDAGKNREGGGSYITYTILTGDLQVKRRYSEFASLRDALVRLHPTLIIPPIPEKHTMADYAAKPTKAKEDQGIIDLRKRMLAVFLNRCRRMKEVREDGVWWRFLDPNASWNEVLHSHPAASIPKQILKAAPLDPANSLPGHAWLPVPALSARLKSVAGPTATGMPQSPTASSTIPSAASHTTPGPQFLQFPPTSQNLSEEELDPYFVNFEASSKELENLLQGSMEKSNRRMLNHYASLGEDMAELGARYNAFSLSENSTTLATAIEKMGQAVDSTYVKTRDLSSELSAHFAEPMRESAQFAGVVRSVLRYRVLKRVQEQMTEDELKKKKELLATLNEQEEQSKRMAATLSGYTVSPSTPKRSTSSASGRTSQDSPRRNREEDVVSVDSDFPPTHGDASPPSAPQGLPAGGASEPNSPTQNHKKSTSGNFVTNKIFGRISHAFHGVVDSDPVKTRHDLIGKTSEQVEQLTEAQKVVKDDVKDASKGVLNDLKRFQGEKEEDLKRYMIAFAHCHIAWAKDNLASWEEAKTEVENIQVQEPHES